MGERLKSVETSRYSLTLFQDDKGKYHIRHEDNSTGEIKYDSYEDYGTADFVFDSKLNKLEGN